MIVLGGILTIAVADALSDAMGIHVSEESEGKHTQKEVWMSTFSTFLSKLIFALSFAVPFLFLEIKTAIISCFVWGGLLLTGLSVYLSRKQKMKSVHVVAEHLAIATIVVVCTYFIGKFINKFPLLFF